MVFRLKPGTLWGGIATKFCPKGKDSKIKRGKKLPVLGFVIGRRKEPTGNHDLGEPLKRWVRASLVRGKISQELGEEKREKLTKVGFAEGQPPLGTVGVQSKRGGGGCVRFQLWSGKPAWRGQKGLEMGKRVYNNASKR